MAIAPPVIAPPLVVPLGELPKIRPPNEADLSGELMGRRRTEWTCPHCEKKLSSQRALEYHLSRRVCIRSLEKKVDWMCPFCHRVYSSKHYLHHHRCEKTLEDQIEVVVELQRRLFLKEQEDTGVVVAEWGKENYNELVGRLGPTFWRILNGNPSRVVIDLMIGIHLNPDFPEGRNMKLTKRKGGRLMVWREGRWKMQSKKAGIELVILMICHWLKKWLNQFGEMLVKKRHEDMERVVLGGISKENWVWLECTRLFEQALVEACE